MSKKKRNRHATAAKKNYFAFVAGDVEAVLCALPLVAGMETDPPIQQEINAVFCNSAAEKLTNRDTQFHLNEIRVIHCAVMAAKTFLEGNDRDLILMLPEVDGQWRMELSKFYFAYKRLEPVFERILEPFMDELGTSRE